MKISFSLLILLVLLKTSVAQTGPLPELTRDKYPRVNGSTSTEPLGQMLAARIWGFEAQLRRGPFRSRQPKAAVALSFAIDTPPAFAIDTPPATIDDFWRQFYRHSHRGTHEAYEALAKGEADLILVARPPTQAELRLSQTQSRAFEVRPFALDALVFLINRTNPIENLTLEQLGEIYTGKTRLWRKVGGLDWPMLTITRNEQSGSGELLDTLLLKGRPLIGDEAATRISEMGELVDRVAANRDAIGPSVWYYARFMLPNEKTKMVAVNGANPTPETIATGSYPLVAPVYVVTRVNLPPQNNAAQLRDWLLSEAGQKLVAESGMVALPVKP